ncbi:MAG TPA: hypothetical protein V6C57_09020 [Coleofasciculaceae cyanobacterium]
MLKSLPLLVLPIFLLLPIASVKASDLDVQTDSARVIINPEGGIRIDSTDGGTIIVPSQTTAIPSLSTPSWQTAPVHVPTFDRYRPWWSNQSLSRPQITYMQCSGSGYSQQISQSSSSGTGVSRSYSSTSTNTCH